MSVASVVGAYLFPCALIEDFSNAKLSSPLTTEAFNRWSTTNSTQCNISVNDKFIKDNYRSLKISYNSTTARRYVNRGVDGTVYDVSSVNNPLGEETGYTHSDFSNYTNIGAWVYADTHDQADDADMLQFGYQDYGDNGPTMVNWNSSVGETGKWCWFDDAIDFQYTKVDRFTIGVDSSSSGNVYINNLVAFKRSTSNKGVYDGSDKAGVTSATGIYNWDNGITFLLTGLDFNNNVFNVTGLLVGNDYRDLLKQITSMETKGLQTYNPVRNPVLKSHSVRDLGNVKTYLFMTESKGPNDSDSNREMYVEPVVISNLAINHVGGSPHIIRFTAKFIKYGGV